MLLLFLCSGLSNLMGSLGQGLGPIFSGAVVAFSFSVVGGEWGAVFLFGSIAFVNAINAVITFVLIQEDQQAEDEHLGLV